MGIEHLRFIPGSEVESVLDYPELIIAMEAALKVCPVSVCDLVPSSWALKVACVRDCTRCCSVYAIYWFARRGTLLGLSARRRLAYI
jgi:hypothetical protein